MKPVALRSQDENRLGREEPSDVMIILTQAFCPNGHNVVRRDDVLFEGHPGICLVVRHQEFSGDVVLSPIHGDHTRVGAPQTLVEGTKFKLCCPECGVELPTIAPCRCHAGGELKGLYLDKNKPNGQTVAICDVYGCHNSKVLDSLDVLSELLPGDEA